MTITHLMEPTQPPKIVNIKSDDYITIPENPVQRDTKNRALKANVGKGHLRFPHPSHTTVSIALLISNKNIKTSELTIKELLDMIKSDDYKKVKLDGHTRSYLWERNLLIKPDILVCAVYFVDEIEQAKDFYRAYDSKNATETPKDRLYSALRDAFTYPPKSTIWKKTGAKVAIEVAFYNNASMPDEKLINIHKTDRIACHVLQTVDNCNLLNIKALNASVMAAMFLSILRDGASALGFWIDFSHGKGVLNEGQMDAVMMAVTYYDEVATMGRSDFTGLRPNYILSGTGREVHMVYTPMYLSYYVAWKSNKKFNIKKKSFGYARNKTKLTIEKFLNNKSYKEFVTLLCIDDFETELE